MGCKDTTFLESDVKNRKINFLGRLKPKHVRIFYCLSQITKHLVERLFGLEVAKFNGNLIDDDFRNVVCPQLLRSVLASLEYTKAWQILLIAGHVA